MYFLVWELSFQVTLLRDLAVFFPCGDMVSLWYVIVAFSGHTPRANLEGRGGGGPDPTEKSQSLSRYFIEIYINFIYSADQTFRVIRKKMNFNRTEPPCYRGSG